MKFLPLVWAGLWRKRVRTLLTMLSVAIAFVLFGLLDGVTSGFDYALTRLTDGARLRITSRVNVNRCPIISFKVSDSRSMRLRALPASAPARLRASSRATFIRASGERSSCEISPSRRCCGRKVSIAALALQVSSR